MRSEHVRFRLHIYIILRDLLFWSELYLNKTTDTMTTNMQQGTLLDVLKKKMRQTKEEMEKYKDECEEYQKRLQLEVLRREDVSSNTCLKLLCTFGTFFINKYARQQYLKPVM